jgi:hypothetical protein
LKKKIYKIISWILLILTVVSIGLMFRRPGGTPPANDPEAASSFDRKLAELAAARERGGASEVRLNETEVNSKVQQILAGAPASGAASLSGVSVHLDRDRLECLLTIHTLGIDMYITLGGKPKVEDHRLELDLSEVKLGSMPAPASAVGAVLRSKLDSPEARDMMKLPDFIQDVRIENSELVIASE